MFACPQTLVDSSFGIKDLEGEWYVVAGTSDLETFDCQKNHFTQLNETHWTVDEYVDPSLRLSCITDQSTN